MEETKKVLFSRTFDAPPARVWKAWTDPAELRQWWGPNDVDVPECELDPHIGGKIRIVMEAGEAMGQYKGTRWPMEGAVMEVEPDAKLSFRARAWTEGAEATTAIDQIQELTLTEEGGKTKMDLRVTVLDTGPDAGMAIKGMQYGFNQQFDKLEKFLM